jgi:hypothetical protein
MVLRNKAANRRLISILLTIGLVLGLFAASSSPATGIDQQEASSLYFPWVPTGATIPGQDGFPDAGPFYGTVTVHNLENAPVSLRYSITAGDADFSDPTNFSSTLLPPQGARTFSMQQFVVETEFEGEATGVVMHAVIQGTDDPARISGVQLQAGAVPIDVDSKTGNSHLIVSGYTGMRSDDIFVAGDVHLPIVQTNSNWNTLIRATNFHSEATQQVDLTLREAGGGGELEFSQMAAPGVPITFDLRDLGVSPEWVGSATISGPAPVAAIAERVKIETNMLIINTAQRGDNLATHSYLPLVLRDWFDWNTGISLLNLTDGENDADIEFYSSEGVLVDTVSISLPPNGMNFIYMPAGDGEPFAGSAFVVSEGGILGAIDEVKYLGDEAEDAGHAMSYMLEHNLGTVGQWISMPLYQKGDPYTGLGDTSGIQAFNPTEEAVDIEIVFHDQSGMMVAEGTFTLEPKLGETFYAMDFPGIPDGMTGTAAIQVMGGAGGVIGISNHVNYAVQHDGSAAFNMMLIPPDPAAQQPPGDFITP